MTDDELDIARMRRAGLVHVEDPEALQAFKEGKLLFDITPHGARLSAFVTKHPEVRQRIGTGENGNYPSAVGFLLNNRRIHFGVKK